MARPCLVCKHPDREEIDLALIGGAVIAHLAKAKGLNVSSLSRHRDRHIPVQVAKAGEIVEELQANQLVAKISSLVTTVEEQIAAAKTDKDHKAVAQLAGQAARMCGLLANIFGKTQAGPIINIVQMPEWQRLQQIILTALRPYPEALRAVAEALRGEDDAADRGHALGFARRG